MAEVLVSDMGGDDAAIKSAATLPVDRAVFEPVEVTHVGPPSLTYEQQLALSGTPIELSRLKRMRDVEGSLLADVMGYTSLAKRLPNRPDPSPSVLQQLPYRNARDVKDHDLDPREAFAGRLVDLQFTKQDHERGRTAEDMQSQEIVSVLDADWAPGSFYAKVALPGLTRAMAIFKSNKHANNDFHKGGDWQFQGVITNRQPNMKDGYIHAEQVGVDGEENFERLVTLLSEEAAVLQESWAAQFGTENEYYQMLRKITELMHQMFIDYISPPEAQTTIEHLTENHMQNYFEFNEPDSWAVPCRAFELIQQLNPSDPNYQEHMIEIYKEVDKALAMSRVGGILKEKNDPQLPHPVRFFVELIDEFALTFASQHLTQINSTEYQDKIDRVIGHYAQLKKLGLEFLVTATEGNTVIIGHINGEPITEVTVGKPAGYNGSNDLPHDAPLGAYPVEQVRSLSGDNDDLITPGVYATARAEAPDIKDTETYLFVNLMHTHGRVLRYFHENNVLDNSSNVSALSPHWLDIMGWGGAEKMYLIADLSDPDHPAIHDYLLEGDAIHFVLSDEKSEISHIDQVKTRVRPVIDGEPVIPTMTRKVGRWTRKNVHHLQPVPDAQTRIYTVDNPDLPDGKISVASVAVKGGMLYGRQSRNSADLGVSMRVMPNEGRPQNPNAR